MGVLFDALRSGDLLEGADDAAVARFMALGSSADHPKRHRFWSAGDVPRVLVVPVTGEAATSTRNAEDREFIDQFHGCGDCIGLGSGLDGLPHATDARVTRAGEFFVIQRRALLRFLDVHPAVRRRATDVIGVLYRRARKEREDVALRPVAQRIAQFLLRRGCARETDGARVLVRVTQAQVAARIGTVREVVSRVFADLKLRGLLGRDGDFLFISDWDGLRAEANAGRADGAMDPDSGPTHEALTRRYFTPMAERRRRHEPAEDAAPCRARLGELSLCCARGCPAALEDRAVRAGAAAPSSRSAHAVLRRA